ncbi:MAG: rhomboid family intramembrane serine protease [Balneolaceae bacterium]|nr:rhomboid family intramembrane serine protease [Balneolaceae bacterium]
MQHYEFFGSVTSILIATNVLVSLLALYWNPGIIDKGFLKPYRVTRQHTWYELLTSGFLHANFTHLFVNMFTLYFFGQVMERVIGPYYFTGLFLSGLIVSGIPSVIKFRNNPNYATLGASGAVGSVLFAFIFLFPMENIYLLLIPIPIPAFVVGVLYLIYSMYESKKDVGKINHEAHTAGSIWGILYLILFVPNTVDHILTVFGML